MALPGNREDGWWHRFQGRQCCPCACGRNGAAVRRTIDEYLWVPGPSTQLETAGAEIPVRSGA